MGDFQLSSFETSVPMSSYLVAFVVADYSCVNDFAIAGPNRNAGVGVCAKSSSKNQLKYALNISKNILEYFEKVYNVTYPLPKLGN